MFDFAGCAFIPKKSKAGRNRISPALRRFTTSILSTALIYSSCSEKNSSTRSAVDPCTQTDFASKNTSQCKQGAQLGVPKLRFDTKYERIWRVGAPLAIIPSSLKANGDDISKCGTIPSLPAGLTISPSLCVISGIPEDAVSGTFEVIAINSLGSSKPESVKIKVEPSEPSLRFDDKPMNAPFGSPIKISPQFVRANGAAITQCGVKEGTAKFPSWAQVDPITCIISGTPDAVLGTTNFTIVATNDVGKSLDTIVSLSVVAAPPALGFATPDMAKVGTFFSVSPSLLRNNGSAISNCRTKTPNSLPNWAAVDPRTCTISGTPDRLLEPSPFIIIATNAAGNSSDAQVVLSVTAATPTLNYSTAINTAGVVGTTLTLTPYLRDNGSPVTNCAIKAGSLSLPSWAIINAKTCVISGTPDAVLTDTPYTIVATNAKGTSADAMVRLSVTAAVPSLSFASTAFVGKIGTRLEIVPNILQDRGSAITNCSIANNSASLPNGASIAPNTCTITGIPTELLATTSYRLVAQNAAGASAEATVTLSVTADTPVLSFEGQADADGVVGIQMSVSPRVLQDNGSPITKCRVKTNTPALPVWANLNDNTCIISGTPTAQLNTTPYTVVATNDVGSSSEAVVRISARNSPDAPSLSYTNGSNINLYLGSIGMPITIKPTSLQRNGAPITNCGKTSDSQNLPSWATVNTNTCEITGVPSGLLSDQLFKLKATNASGDSAPALVRITVTAGIPTLSFTGASGINGSVGTAMAISPTKLEPNGSPITDCSVKILSTPLPSWAIINRNTCVISGIPDKVLSAQPYTIVATNSAGQSTDSIISLSVAAAAPTLSYIGATGVNSKIGESIKVLPTTLSSNGSSVTRCYIKEGPSLPSWARVNQNTCEIDGKPNALLESTVFSIVASNKAGVSAIATLSLTVSANKPTLIYSSEDNFVGSVGSPMSIAPIFLNNNGAIITGCTTKVSTNPLPSWANLNSSTCVLSGIPTERLTPTSFTILATNTAGQSMDALVTFSVVDVPVVSFLGTSLAARSLGQAVAITPTTLDPRGADITNCSASPTLPEGLSLSPTLCTISGTPTKVSSATYQIIATNLAGQSNPATIVINIHPPSPSLDYTNQWDIIDGETNTGIVKDWPNIPPNFEIPNYQLFAKHYYELAFASTAHQVNGRDVLKHTRWADNQNFTSLVSLFNFPTLFQASFFDSIHAELYPHISESLTVFPGIISSALISKTTTETPRRSEVASYVRMMKRYFHPLTLDGKPNAGWFGNSPHKGGGNGGSFWYDLGPNVYAMQLLELFESSEIEPPTIPGQAPEESFDQLCRRMADTLYEMTSFLKQTPTSVPSFDYTAIKIVNGKLRAYDPHCADARPNSAQSLPREKLFCPIDFHPIYPVHCAKPQNDPTDPAPWFCFDHPNAYEPSAAGAFIYIGLAAYERWKDPRHLEMATAAMNFLLEYDRNPVYELVYNHGILGAARMNQQYGTDYDIKKLLRWAFVRSDKQIDPSDWTTWPNASTNARPDVGVLNEMWGSYPTYGLWGAKANPGAYGGYAFYMNTVSQAATLAPIAKYYPNYAKMFGKYLLHVASNSKYFFSQYVPDELEDPTTFEALSTRLDSRYMSIPYEGFRKKVSESTTAINLKGDAVQHGWAHTDLSAYSGALSGMFASIMIRDSHDTSTGNPIVFWDLNITDIPSEKAYPSYLVYNPTTSQKTVTLKRSDIRTYSGLNYNVSPTIGAWDLVSNQWIFSGAGDITFTLPAGDAKVFSLVPSAHSCSVAHSRAICSTSGQFYSVLDYRVP